MYNYKQAIIVRQDLKLPKGKLAAQVAHASVEAVLKSNKETIKQWRNTGMAKIVLKTESKENLFKIKSQAEELNIATAIISDAGKTVVEPGTITCLGIGPATTEKIDKVIKELKLL